MSGQAFEISRGEYLEGRGHQKSGKGGQQRSPGNARNKSSDLVELGPLASYDLIKIPSRARRVFKTGEEPGVMYS